MVNKPVQNLSHRGVELAAEVHAHFSRSTPGSLTFREFRGYLAAMGRPKEGEGYTDKAESWKMFMEDLGGLDENGGMTKEGMIRYRDMIEPEYPLEYDLLKIGLDVLPPNLQQWSDNRERYERVDLEGAAEENKKLLRRMGKKKAAEFLIEGTRGRIEKESFQQLLGDCGENYTGEQICQMLDVHYW